MGPPFPATHFEDYWQIMERFFASIREFNTASTEADGLKATLQKYVETFEHSYMDERIVVWYLKELGPSSWYQFSVPYTLPEFDDTPVSQDITKYRLRLSHDDE
jgi:hypothetical protein